MSSFTAPLEVTVGPSAWRPWVTLREFTFWVGDEPKPGEMRTGHVVPMGFAFNFGDIPWWIEWLLPRDDPAFVQAFALHDFLCLCRGFPRLVAAAVFHEALMVLARKHRRPWWRVWMMTAGVMLYALVKPYPDDQPLR